jgi:hypothetical protein
MIKYYRKYKTRTPQNIVSQDTLTSYFETDPLSVIGTSSVNPSLLSGSTINIPIYLTQNIEDLGIYEDVGKTESELNNK